MSVQNLLGDAGACPEIEWNGKRWKIGHPTQGAKGCLEELVAAKAVAEVKAIKGVLPADDYAEMFKALLSRITTGYYRTFFPGWIEQTTGGGGAVLFLLSLLRERHPDATEADAVGLAGERGDEVQAALARVVPSFFEMLVASATHIPPDQKAAMRSAMAGVVAAAFPPPTPSA